VGEREALAMIWAVNKFHRFLYGQHFVFECDPALDLWNICRPHI